LPEYKKAVTLSGAESISLKNSECCQKQQPTITVYKIRVFVDAQKVSKSRGCHCLAWRIHKSGTSAECHCERKRFPGCHLWYLEQILVFCVQVFTLGIQNCRTRPFRQDGWPAQGKKHQWHSLNISETS